LGIKNFLDLVVFTGDIILKSIVYDKSKKIKYIIPSKIKTDAKKIYNLMEVPLSLTPYILCKL